MQSEPHLEGEIDENHGEEKIHIWSGCIAYFFLARLLIGPLLSAGDTSNRRGLRVVRIEEVSTGTNQNLVMLRKAHLIYNLFVSI